MIHFGPYTVYPVRWHNQKGDILEVCVQKVSHLGGGDKCLIFVCVCPISACPISKNRGGGTELIQFQNGERTSKLYLSKPTWYERQTFYARTARATLINFDAKVIVNCV